MSARLEREADTLGVMIEMFCRDRHGQDGLCSSCRDLLAYARKRTRACRFGADKPVCSACPVHCYRREMRERIREVMSYAGPRMISRHPILAARHLLDKRRKAPSGPGKTP
ncbi:MAG: nitrous oxide-stimulated promoter family protein [Pseudomonadota bacterium]|nr:nitrous oxide-stimulated promoter family protein [Pseudomonadota bacterium]